MIRKAVQSFILLFLCISCKGEEKQKQADQPGLSKKLKSHVEALTGIKPTRSWSNPRSLAKAADYIEKFWQNQGLKVTSQSYSVMGRKVRNLITRIGPEKGPLLIVGAHYDTVHITPGADDNASGVAGLLELSRLLKPQMKKLQFPVMFVAYTLEEPPYFNTKHMGSYIHAESLKKSGQKVKGMISLEMIGYYSDKKNSQTFPIPEMQKKFGNVGNFISFSSNYQSRQFLKELLTACPDSEKLKRVSFHGPEKPSRRLPVLQLQE